MKILFVHKNFPAQFGRLANWLAGQGWDVTFATARKGARSDQMRIVPFREHREPSASTHHYLTGTERAVIAGQGMVRAAIALREQGYIPDVVVAHSGWGVGFFIKDVWPETQYVQYAEWYYSFPHADGTPYFTAQHPVEESARARSRNAPFWLDFSAADATICPTRYQASRFPEKVRDHITVLSDGFDTKTHCPGPRDPDFLQMHGIPPDASVVTYIARGMEPTRGFPEVMKAAERLHRARPDVHVVIIADDRVAYGPKPDGASWKERMLATLDLDLTRLHFTGLVSRSDMIRYLRASDAHLYLSAPFVLSWSFVEAMSCGAPLIAARSAPVEEFMTHETEGLLVDPYNTGEVADWVVRLLDDRDLARSLGSAARDRIVRRYDADTIVFPDAARFLSDLLAHSPRAAGSPPNTGRPIQA
ncbi:glycosyltransferase [uncultured Roseobacter sp.]|uniref:glycosyltransferase n=1 Tax=uncultured Roseobacter sp. TaxID=114847 RepID=UPI002622D6AF|nr:glycosyltransferase [uncultured Roseobacter sp.]